MACKQAKIAPCLLLSNGAESLHTDESQILGCATVVVKLFVFSRRGQKAEQIQGTSAREGKFVYTALRLVGGPLAITRRVPPSELPNEKRKQKQTQKWNVYELQQTKPKRNYQTKWREIFLKLVELSRLQFLRYFAGEDDKKIRWGVICRQGVRVLAPSTGVSHLCPAKIVKLYQRGIASTRIAVSSFKESLHSHTPTRSAPNSTHCIIFKEYLLEKSGKEVGGRNGGTLVAASRSSTATWAWKGAMGPWNRVNLHTCHRAGKAHCFLNVTCH